MFGLLLVYILTAVAVIGSLQRPLIGLFVYVGFAMLRPQYMWQFAGNMSGLSQLVGIAMLVGWAINGFGGLSVGKGRPVVVVLLVFFVWAALSSMFGIDPDSSYAWVIELAKVVAPFLVGVTLLNSKKLVWLMMWTIVAAHGYIAYDMNKWYYMRGYNYVWESGYGYMDNNSFGLSLVAVIGPAAALALVAKKWPERLLAAVCVVLILSTVVLTYSRGAMLGLGVVGIAAVLFVPKRPTYVAVMLIGLLAVARLAGPQVRARFETVFAEEAARDGSAQSRVDLWAACFDIATKNPMLGIGPHNFPLVAGQYGFTAGKEAHSTWMQVMAEMGFPGLALLALFYLIALFKLLPIVWKKWTEDRREEAALAAGVLMSLSGFFVSAQFVTMSGLETPYYLTMIGVALIKIRSQPVLVVNRVPTRPADWRPPLPLAPVRR